MLFNANNGVRYTLAKCLGFSCQVFFFLGLEEVCSTLSEGWQPEVFQIYMRPMAIRIRERDSVKTAALIWFERNAKHSRNNIIAL